MRRGRDNAAVPERVGSVAVRVRKDGNLDLRYGHMGAYRHGRRHHARNHPWDADLTPEQIAHLRAGIELFRRMLEQRYPTPPVL
jgi:hypothetical protein